MHVPDFSSLAPATVGPVQIGDRWWIVHEADPDSADRFRAANLRTASLTFNEDDTKTMRGLEGLAKSESVLIRANVYEVEGKDGKLRMDGDDPDKKHLVDDATYKRWPTRLRRWLFDTIKEISDLDENDTEESLERQIARLQKRLAKLRGLAKDPT